MTNSIVKRLEQDLLPQFKKIADRINQTIPDVIARAHSSPTGSFTEFQGHSFSIDCVFQRDIKGENDSVCLSIDLCHLTTTPRISADVCWGSPNAYIEAEFYEWHGSFTENGLKVSDKVLEDLYKELPRLYKALFRALNRRKPGNE